MCLASASREPLGLGPDQFRYTTHRHGFDYGRGAHTTWLQIVAEQGIPGAVSILLFYGLCWKRLLPLANGMNGTVPELRTAARIVFAALPGFAASAQFVSLPLVEIPYYTALVGAGVLKLWTATHSGTFAARTSTTTTNSLATCVPRAKTDDEFACRNRQIRHCETAEIQ